MRHIRKRFAGALERLERRPVVKRRDLRAFLDVTRTASRRRPPPRARGRRGGRSDGRPRRPATKPSTGVDAAVLVDERELEARRPGIDDEDVHARPRPGADLGVVLAVLAGVGTGTETTLLHLLTQVRGTLGEPGNAVDHVDHEMEAIEVVEHHHVERRRRRPFLLVAADMEVRVVPAPVGEPVDQPRVAVVGEDDRPRGREERIELRRPGARADARTPTAGASGRRR